MGLWLAQMHLEQGQAGEALIYLSSLEGTELRWYGDYGMGKAYEGLGQPEEAARDSSGTKPNSTGHA